VLSDQLGERIKLHSARKPTIRSTIALQHRVADDSGNIDATTNPNPLTHAYPLRDCWTAVPHNHQFTGEPHYATCLKLMFKRFDRILGARESHWFLAFFLAVASNHGNSIPRGRHSMKFSQHVFGTLLFPAIPAVLAVHITAQTSALLLKHAAMRQRLAKSARLTKLWSSASRNAASMVSARHLPTGMVQLDQALRTLEQASKPVSADFAEFSSPRSTRRRATRKCIRPLQRRSGSGITGPTV